MARKISIQRETEYNEIKRILLLLNTYWGGKKFADSQLKIMDHNETIYGKSVCLSGLKEALNDSLDGLSEFTKKEIAEVDCYLKLHHAPTLTQLCARKRNYFARIIKRGRIKNDVEYYMLNECLNDIDDSSYSASERKYITQLLAQYELGQ